MNAYHTRPSQAEAFLVQAGMTLRDYAELALAGIPADNRAEFARNFQLLAEYLETIAYTPPTLVLSELQDVDDLLAEIKEAKANSLRTNASFMVVRKRGGADGDGQEYPFRLEITGLRAEQSRIALEILWGRKAGR